LLKNERPGLARANHGVHGHGVSHILAVAVLDLYTDAAPSYSEPCGYWRALSVDTHRRRDGSDDPPLARNGEGAVAVSAA
jgi:hypothetical protein